VAERAHSIGQQESGMFASIREFKSLPTVIATFNRT
jgi:hypothetical protein